MPPARSTAHHEHDAARAVGVEPRTGGVVSRTGGAEPPAVAVASCVSRPAFGG